MRRFFLAWVLVFVGTCAFAQTAAQDSGELTCPLDGFHLAAPMGEQGDRAGGWDSDQCAHDLYTQSLSYEVVVCPRCNFAAARPEFAKAVPEGKKPMLLRALARSRYRGVKDGLADIPAWERFALAADCARVLDDAKNRLSFVKAAAWCARVEACRPASLAYSSLYQPITVLPMRIDEYRQGRAIESVLREIDEKIAAADKPEEKDRLTLHLAMMCQRAGFAARRDKAVAEMEKARVSDASVAAPLERFKKLVGIEGEYETQFVDLMRAYLKTVETRGERAYLAYLLADNLRRLGRDADAVAEFRAGRKMMSQPSEPRAYTDHFLSILAPGEPLPTPEAEKAPEPKVSGTETAPAPGPKATEPPAK